jgi:hypothetical protein
MKTPEKYLAQKRQDYAKHREERLAYVKEYYHKNREQKLAYAKEYRAKHAEKLRAYNQKNREKKRNYNRAYNIANREKMIEKSNRYFETHPEYRQAYNAGYYQRNRTRERKRIMAWQKEQSKTNPLYRLQQNLRARIHLALKRHRLRKVVRTFDITGCSIEFLAGWLESRFQDGMTWDNRGMFGWHIDHVIPCSAFDLSDPEQLRQCFHYTNLQPLWAKDNLRKSNFVGEPVRNWNTQSEEREHRANARVEP